MTVRDSNRFLAARTRRGRTLAGLESVLVRTGSGDARVVLATYTRIESAFEDSQYARRICAQAAMNRRFDTGDGRPAYSCQREMHGLLPASESS